MKTESSSSQDLASSALPVLLAVTGSQRPYIFDLPQLLSLPSGFEFRFRYRHRWVDDELMRRITEHGDAFAGREMVILFHSQNSARLIPVRRGVVIGLESIGPMIYLRFRVGEFPKIGLSIESYSRTSAIADIPAATQLQNVASELIGPIGVEGSYDLHRPLPDGYYVRQARQPLSSEAWDAVDACAAWARLAAILHCEPSLTGIPFFYVLGFRRETGEALRASIVENRFSITREQIRGFALAESERYRMRVVEWSEPPKDVEQPPVRVRCEFNTAHLALEGASDLVVGRYDVIEFTFSAVQNGYSEIVLRAEPLARTDTGSRAGEREAHTDVPHWETWPSIFVARVPIVVRRKARRIVLPVLTALVGFGVYLFVAPEVDDERLRALTELIAIVLLMFGMRGLGDVLAGLFKLTADLKRLKGGPAAWGTDER